MILKNELQAECMRNNLSLGKLATTVGINASTLYRKIKEDGFSSSEMLTIKDILKLDNNMFLHIFFGL